MRVISIFVSLALGALCIASLARSASSVPKDPFLGISPEDEKYYKSSSEIKCKDGSDKFAKAQLNDDFCDCPDGTDEPGTSACPNGKFYCQNAGHVPKFIFSSRVNDGICDCCDGSDEYDGKLKCPNTCWEAGKVARDKLKKKIATYREGVALRKREVEQAKVAVARDDAELKKLKNEEKILKDLVQQLKERKEQIEKAEEKERLQKEKEEKEKKEAEQAAKSKKGEAEEKDGSEELPMGRAHDDTIGTMDDSDSDQELGDEVENHDASNNGGSPVKEADQHPVRTKEEFLSSESEDNSPVSSETEHNAGKEVPPGEVKKEPGEIVSQNTEGLSREELGRLVASRWTGEKSEKQTEKDDAARDSDHEDHEEMPQVSHDEEYDGYATDSDDEHGKYDDHDIEKQIDEAYEDEDHDDSSSPYKSDIDDELDLSDTTKVNTSWLEKIQDTVRSILKAVNLFQTPVDKSEAARIRKEYDESSAKLSKIQSRISSLEQKLRHDFGLEKEFYSFYGHCFENKQNKYVYKVCPYKQASQVESYTTTCLGHWDKFEDSYRVMIFSNGDKCWNGPARSLKVKLRCGLKNEVADVDEPSRCEYMALLSTPALCLGEKLKELEEKLDLMNQEQPLGHDEL